MWLGGVVLLVLLTQYQHLVAVGQRCGEYVVVAAVGQFQALAQLLYALGEIAYGYVGLLQ